MPDEPENDCRNIVQSGDLQDVTLKIVLGNETSCLVVPSRYPQHFITDRDELLVRGLSRLRRQATRRVSSGRRSALQPCNTGAKVRSERRSHSPECGCGSAPASLVP